MNHVFGKRKAYDLHYNVLRSCSGMHVNCSLSCARSEYTVYMVANIYILRKINLIVPKKLVVVP